MGKSKAKNRKGGKGGVHKGGGKQQSRAERRQLHEARNKAKYDRSEIGRMCKALKPHGLAVHEVIGDGNCFFRAVSDQLHGHQEEHLALRAQACEYMAANRDYFAPFISEDGDDDFSSDIDVRFDAYLEAMLEPAEWGGQLEVQALAQALNCSVVMFQSDAPSYRINGDSCGRSIRLSYHDGEHYNSVRAHAELDELQFSEENPSLGGTAPAAAAPAKSQPLPGNGGARKPKGGKGKAAHKRAQKREKARQHAEQQAAGGEDAAAAPPADGGLAVLTLDA